MHAPAARKGAQFGGLHVKAPLRELVRGRRLRRCVGCSGRSVQHTAPVAWGAGHGQGPGLGVEGHPQRLGRVFARHVAADVFDNAGQRLVRVVQTLPAKRRVLGALRAAPAQEFFVQPKWAVPADVADPAGDDRGRNGLVTYPTDPTFAPRQMALRRVKVATSVGALRLDLTLAGISAVWSPPQGFDHVVFTVFIELPGQPGGASATPAALVTTDGGGRTVSMLFFAAALGGLKSLSGAKVYVTTWNYDGGCRALRPAAQPCGMGGGATARPR